MEITLKLFATLRTYSLKEQQVAVKDGARPRDLIQDFKIPESEVSIIMINGRGAKMDTVLKDGDVLALFPPVGGG